MAKTPNIAVDKNGKPVQKPKYDMLKAHYELSEAIAHLIDSESFYGLFFQRFTRRIGYEVPTAAVAMINNKVHFLFNPEFMGMLTVKERMAVVKHECLHLLMLHLERGVAYANKQIANIAMDASINQFIKDLPDLCVTLKSIEQQYGVKLDADQPWEKYYEALKNWDEQDKAKGGSGVDGDSFDDHGQWEGTLVDEDGNPVLDENGNPIKVPLNKEWIKDQVKDAANRAADACGREAGKFPDICKKLVDELNRKSKVNWRTLLRFWFAQNVDALREASMMKENRKVEGIFPGRKRVPVPKLVIYGDESGSVGDNEYAALMAEACEIGKQWKCDITYIPFCCEVYEEHTIKQGKLPKRERYYGGTSFDAVMRDAKKRKLRNFIVLTDAGDECSNYFGAKPLWVLIPNAYKQGEHLKGQKIVIDDADQPKKKK